jgi:hypothetical protein
MNSRTFLDRRPWRTTQLPPEVTAVPTMLAPDEQALLYSLARDYASGDGAIVDAGCFLGGSTVALLAGLRDREESWEGPPVASYDLFRVEEYTLAEFFADHADLDVGASFRHHYDTHVAGFDVPHTVYEGDITTLHWAGGPIEILFLDVIKTPDINDAVLRSFMPHVIPGRTVIVHQDYGWGDLPWLHITVELMRDSLKWIDAVPYCTHAYLVERAIDPDLLNMSIWSDLDQEAQLEILDGALQRSSGDMRGMLELSKAVLFAVHGQTPEAKRMLQSVERRYDSPTVLACKNAIDGYLSS